MRMIAARTGHACVVTLTFMLLCVLFGPMAQAQETEEPRLNDLIANFKKPYLSVGALFQFVGDFQPERSFAGNDGFSIGNMRLSLSGELDQGIGYFFQTNFATSPAILDAKAYYRFSPALVIDLGLYKAPFSRELLTGAAALDFVRRSQVVTALAPARQIGASLRGDVADGVVSYGVGVFNGNKFNGNRNDSNDFLYVARLSVFPKTLQGTRPGDRLELAINVARSQDEDTDFGGGFLSDFQGEQTLVGGDFRLTRDRFLLAGEFIAARLEFAAGPTADPTGFHLTGGYQLTEWSQFLVRWDSFSPDGVTSESDLVLLGYNIWPTGATQLRANYVIPTVGGVDNHQLLIGAQLSF